MTSAVESIILCEGYHDRAFLRAWLLACGCEDWKDKVYPPLKKELKGGGAYGFRTPNDRWVRIVPVGGDGKLLNKADVFVRESNTSSIQRIVLVWDGDDTPGAPSDSRENSFESWAGNHKAQAVGESPDFELTGGLLATRLSLILWRAGDPRAAELPDQQTLERLACAAIRDVHPDRCRAVMEWLAARPSPPSDEKRHKAHAASYMAGWFSDRGYEGFFDAVWEDRGVAEALKRRLDAIGAARVIDSLLT